MHPRFIALALAPILLAACSNGVQKDAAYKSAVELRDAMVKSGYSCPQWSDKDTTGGFDAGACLSDNRDQIRVYTTQDAREKDTESAILGAQLIMASVRVDMAVLVGTNWTVSGPKRDVEQLQPKLGGYIPDISQVRLPGR